MDDDMDDDMNKTLLGDGETTTMIMVRDGELIRRDDDGATIETDAITAEMSPPEMRALPSALEGTPAYLVEVHAPRKLPCLMAVLATLEEARLVAESVHPAIADVVVRELPLPCDATSLVRAMGTCRSWTRDGRGAWTPSFESPGEDPGATQIVGSFR